VESPFEVLGIDPDAAESTIIEAYRRRVKEAHPDHGGSEEEFHAVRTAYERIRAGHDPSEGGREVGAARGETRYREVRRQEDEDQDDDPEVVRVEYLDYDVLEDHGWYLTDEDLFEKAADAGLAPEDHGRLVVEEGETLLEAAENRGFAWPFACRGGACTNCAVAVLEGEMPTPPGHILPTELAEQGIRLACISSPVSSDSRIVYNVKHLPGVEELVLPASRFERAHSND